MRQLQRKEEIPFFQRLILPWEKKLQFDTYLVWDGSYRWFCSDNVIPLDRYRTSEEIDRIRANVLRRLWHI
jgi:hypothetical protein